MTWRIFCAEGRLQVDSGDGPMASPATTPAIWIEWRTEARLRPRSVSPGFTRDRNPCASDHVSAIFGTRSHFYSRKSQQITPLCIADWTGSDLVAGRRNGRVSKIIVSRLNF